MGEANISRVRETALDVIGAIRREGAWSDLSLKNEIRKRRLDKRDAALLTEIVYGVLRNSFLLDFYIETYANRPVKKLSPLVADVLRMSVYQLRFLDRVPPHAVTSDAVGLVQKRGNARAAGLVNAVLRRAAAERTSEPEIPGKGSCEYLSVKYSHPLPLVKRFVSALGYDEAEKLLNADNSPAGVVCRVNTLKTDMEGAISALRADGADAQPYPGLENCLILSGTGDVETLSAHKNGLIYIQDAASQLAVMAVDPRPGDVVVDVCAAPGGKTFIAAQLMHNEGKIYSFDVHPHKIPLIKAGADRLGTTSVNAYVRDALVPPQPDDPLFGSADIVICDAPCSGTGIIRRKPDIRYKPDSDISAMPDIQSRILKNAAGYLKTGGKMLYSTCSVLSEENSEVLEAFLKETDCFEAEPFSVPLYGEAPNGMAALYPSVHGTDGFFISVIRRVR